MTKLLRISPELALPLDAVTKKFGFFGQNGTGKTYAAMKLAELMLDAGAQIVAIDPVGKWYGLRLAANGIDPSGIEIPVFGGLHGDIPLESTAGELIADVIIDRGISAVLDVSQFEYDAERARFMEHFARRLFHRKKASPSAIHLFVEEAQEFLPIAPQRGEEKMLHEVLRIGKIGRNHGFGWTLITPRPQEITTKARNLSEVVLAFQLNGTHERKAIAEWVKEKGQDLDVVDLLPKLKQGTAHAWSPSWLEFSGTVHVEKKRTFDASATPKVGAKVVEPRPLGSIDLEQLRVTMAATIEKQKAEDPKLLQKEITRLKGELAKAGKVAARAVPAPPDPAEIDKFVYVGVQQAMKAEWVRLRQIKQRLEEARRTLAAANAAVVKLPGLLDGSIAALDLATEGLMKQDTPAPAALKLPVRHASRVAASAAAPGGVRAAGAPVRPPAGSGDASLPKGERACLIAIAQHGGEGVTREQLTVLTGYKRATRNTYIQRMQATGHIALNNGRVVATTMGIEALGSNFESLPTGDDLRRHWLNTLPAGESKVLGVVAEAYPDSVTRDAITETTGYMRATRNTYLQRLAARHLITSQGGEVRASETLFG